MSNELRATERSEWDDLPVGAWFYCYTPGCTFPHTVMERTSSGCTQVCGSPWTHPGVPAEFRGIAERHNAAALAEKRQLSEEQVKEALRGDWSYQSLTKKLNAALLAGEAEKVPPTCPECGEDITKGRHSKLQGCWPSAPPAPPVQPTG